MKISLNPKCNVGVDHRVRPYHSSPEPIEIIIIFSQIQFEFLIVICFSYKYKDSYKTVKICAKSFFD